MKVIYIMADSMRRDHVSVYGGPAWGKVHTPNLERFAEMIALGGIISIPENTILDGGVLARLRQSDEVFSLGGFARDTCRYAWRLTRLMVLGLICYWIVFRLVNQSLGGYVGRWTEDWASDRAVFWVKLGVTLLLVLGLGLVNLVMDYARVKLVLEDSTSAAWAFLSSLGFCLTRFRSAAAVYALPALGGLALLGVYRLVLPWPLINAPGTEGPWGQYRDPLMLALLFIVQQVVMFGRYWFRVATWASEWSYYAGVRAPAATDVQSAP